MLVPLFLSVQGALSFSESWLYVDLRLSLLLLGQPFSLHIELLQDRDRVLHLYTQLFVTAKAS